MRIEGERTRTQLVLLGVGASATNERTMAQVHTVVVSRRNHGRERFCFLFCVLRVFRVKLTVCALHREWPIMACGASGSMARFGSCGLEMRESGRASSVCALYELTCAVTLGHR
jgi:hypothetical protein